MNFKRILSIVFISFLAFSFTIGFTWRAPIEPGDSVIDIIRLNASAEITAKAMLVALQTYQSYENKVTSLLSTRTFDETNSTLQVVQKSEDQLALKGPINNNIDGWDAFKISTNDKLSTEAIVMQSAAMRTVQENANYDAINIIRTQNINLQKINTEINQLAGVTEPGNLGQNQVGINQRALMLQMMMGNLYAEAASDIATETETKEEIVREKVAARQAKDLLINTYDPFNRTAQDNTIHPKTPALGYPHF